VNEPIRAGNAEKGGRKTGDFQFGGTVK